MDDRNRRVKEYINLLISNAKKETRDFTDLPDYHDLITILNDLIFVKAAGFRGVVITAIAGKFIDASYDPLNNFYKCNPRAIFEKSIYYSLQENEIPCGLSDPLNVAKNTSVLDENWASGKRPEKAALAAINFLRAIEQHPEHQERLIALFFLKLVEFSNTIKEIRVDIPDSAGISQQEIATKIAQFAIACPESGTIPQMVVALALNKLYEHSTIKAEGGDESVFGTNTTSKKPGDIWLEENGEPINIYEVTVKKVDYKRLDDCISSLSHHGVIHIPVTFICRIPEDISELATIGNFSVNRNGKAFGFIDITSFIHIIFSQLTDIQIQDILKKLSDFIDDINRPINTKLHWKRIFEGL